MAKRKKKMAPKGSNQEEEPSDSSKESIEVSRLTAGRQARKKKKDDNSHVEKEEEKSNNKSDKGSNEDDELSMMGYEIPTSSGVIRILTHVDNCKRMWASDVAPLLDGQRVQGDMERLSRSQLKQIGLQRFRRFSEFEEYPRSLYLRNPRIVPDVYRLNRGHFGDATSPEDTDEVWTPGIEESFISIVRQYLEEYAEEFELGTLIPFSIQILDYDSDIGKSKHHDPEPYKVIAGMNMLGSAELQLYHGQKLFQSIVLPQGSIYIMHGDATFPMKHAVGAPVGGRRVAAVARFVERGSIWGLYEGSMFYP